MVAANQADIHVAQVLDAFMHCVAQYGIEGSTLAKISESSGVPRPLLRYHFGNREQMVVNLLDHTIARFNALTDEMIASLPEEQRLDAMMDWLFDDSADGAEATAVFQVLVSASQRFDGYRERLLKHMDGFERAILAELIRAFPHAIKSDCQTAASGIAAICWNVEAVLPLRPSIAWKRKQRVAAEWLIERLRLHAMPM